MTPFQLADGPLQSGKVRQGHPAQGRIDHGAQHRAEIGPPFGSLLRGQALVVVNQLAHRGRPPLVAVEIQKRHGGRDRLFYLRLVPRRLRCPAHGPYP